MKNMKNRETYEARLNIGFPEDPRQWSGLPAVFSKSGLEIAGHPVMEDWEREYMNRLASIAASKPRRILEVGFGMGISARAIQAYEVDEHVIIEANRDVYEKLCAFSREASQKVVPVFGFWEDIAPGFPEGSFSAILFDTYPLRAEEIHGNHFPFFREAHRLLEKGGIFTYYSDESASFSRAHLRALKEAGFRDIRGEACPVDPPQGCRYWREQSLLVPIVFK